MDRRRLEKYSIWIGEGGGLQYMDRRGGYNAVYGKEKVGIIKYKDCR